MLTFFTSVFFLPTGTTGWISFSELTSISISTAQTPAVYIHTLPFLPFSFSSRYTTFVVSHGPTLFLRSNDSCTSSRLQIFHVSGLLIFLFFYIFFKFSHLNARVEGLKCWRNLSHQLSRRQFLNLMCYAYGCRALNSFLHLLIISVNIDSWDNKHRTHAFGSCEWQALPQRIFTVVLFDAESGVGDYLPTADVSGAASPWNKKARGHREAAAWHCQHGAASAVWVQAVGSNKIRREFARLQGDSSCY